MVLRAGSAIALCARHHGKSLNLNTKSEISNPKPCPELVEGKFQNPSTKLQMGPLGVVTMSTIGILVICILFRI